MADENVNGNSINEETTVDENAAVSMKQFKELGGIMNQLVESVNHLNNDAATKAEEEKKAFERLSKSKQAKIIFNKERQIIDEEKAKEERELKLKYAAKYKVLNAKHENAFIEGVEEDCALANQTYENIGKRVGATVAPVTKRLGGLLSGIKKMTF